MQFMQIESTGCRLVAPITKLGQAGLKHHGIVIGKCLENGHVYVAENMYTGYQLATYDDFVNRYSINGAIQVFPNDGIFTDMQVAQRALNELADGGVGKYDLIFNNCESFSNRAMHGHSISSQVINTLAISALLITGVCLIKRANAS